MPQVFPIFTRMKRIFLFISALIFFGFRCTSKNVAIPSGPTDSSTSYIGFQLFISGSTEPSGTYQALNPFISAARMEAFFGAVQSEVGPSPLPNRKAAIIIGPIALDFSNEDITALINQSFDLARRYDIAVGFHIDEGKFWAGRPDLWKNPDNIEWVDWNGTPNTSADIPWVSTKLAPQICFNAPLVKMALHDFMSNIAIAIKTNLDQLARSNKEYLYAGTLVGWEPGMYTDRDSQLSSGYHALHNEGYRANNMPNDIDQERVNIVHEYLEWISEPLAAAGVPVSKTYSHVVFLPRYYYDSLALLNPEFGKKSYAEINHFSLPELALGNAYSPGFSTYPLNGVLTTIHDLINHSGWASSEGTNSIPDMPPSPTGYGMESYLARHYNYGCRLVNIFAFHLRGDPFTDALNDVSEGADAINVYKKFLRGERLIE